ncbi:protein ITPRID2 isoform 1-T2 [Menidia menidia]
MEAGVLGVEGATATDGTVRPISMADMRRRAWAKSKDSSGQESKPEHCEPQQSQTNGDQEKPSQEPGQVQNKIASWLVECRTPLGASLDDQSPSPSKGAPKNGCSFEDDLSLGAEADHLQSTNNKPESCFGLAADQKRSRYKEKGRSMNSTGSGKSSTVSSVSELLDLYEEDPEEILLNLGFGREEPDLSAKIPSRFFNGSSSARGIDIKVYLGAQLQRMELENPNYALTSRFRQIEVLTTVANEFFQLYSQVSGQPVPRISSKELGGEGEGGGGESGGGGAREQSPPLKRSNSARNVANLLKKTISKHNLLGSASESPEARSPGQHAQLNGQAASPDHPHLNGHAHTCPDPERRGTDSDHQAEVFSQKHIRRKENCSLATVAEESSADGETDRMIDISSEQNSTGAERQPESTGHHAAKQRTEDEGPRVAKEKGLTSTPSTLAPPQLAQLRTENADSFDMEEIQTNEDEALPHGTSRTNDLSRTVSQQSDSSGFAEEPSVDSNSYLKVQESCDSCDSETTVTSHPSQDLSTPHALDQAAFDLPDSRAEEVEPADVTGTGGRGSSKEEEALDGSLEHVVQYRAHHLPKTRPAGIHQDACNGKQVDDGDRIDPDTEPQPDGAQQSPSAFGQEPQMELQQTQNLSEREPPHGENLTETTTNTDRTQGAEAHVEPVVLDDSVSVYPAPPSPVLSALNRAKHNQLSRTGQNVNPQSNDALKTPGVGRGRRGIIPMKRSSSLPSSLLSPRVVSSVRIQFGQGQAVCTPPRYSLKYAQEAAEHKEEEMLEEKEEVDGGQSNCVSTLIINPGPNEKPPSTIPPKPIPHHLLRSSHSLQSSSPPPDWSPGANTLSWSTQSVPDLSSAQQHPRQFQQSMSTSQTQTQQGWNPHQMMIPNPSPSPVFSDPNPSLGSNSNPYPHPQHPYATSPNLFNQNNISLNHFSSLTSLHNPPPPTVPPHCSLTNLHQQASTSPHFHRGTPTMHHPSYNHPYSQQSPYHTPPQIASPYLGYHGYHLSPHTAFAHPSTQYPPVAPEHSLHPGLAHSAPGFLANLGSSPNPGLTPPAAPGSGPGHFPSSTEMQLRRVLHDIRGTVHSLSQSQDNTPDALGDHRATTPSYQSLAEFQQKRRSLNVFRNQMMDLELSIMQQQALVYKHLSPIDRMEAEQLQSLRSAVREELQELEQQLEDRLIGLTQHPQRRGLHRGSSFDSLSTASALRAMEPVSDLFREQFLLQSELSYDGHGPSTNPSTRSTSPVRGEREAKHRQGLYRASINITPAPPSRPNAHPEEGEEEEKLRDIEGAEVREGGGALGEKDAPQSQEAAGNFKAENFQQLIREIRESVAQEVRREIYSELLAAASPRGSPLPARQHPL